jgi:NAD(P)H-dependent FMN reductase
LHVWVLNHALLTATNSDSTMGSLLATGRSRAVTSSLGGTVMIAVPDIHPLFTKEDHKTSVTNLSRVSECVPRFMDIIVIPYV